MYHYNDLAFFPVFLLFFFLSIMDFNPLVCFSSFRFDPFCRCILIRLRLKQNYRLPVTRHQASRRGHLLLLDARVNILNDILNVVLYDFAICVVSPRVRFLEPLKQWVHLSVIMVTIGYQAPLSQLLPLPCVARQVDYFS